MSSWKASLCLLFVQSGSYWNDDRKKLVRTQFCWGNVSFAL